MSAQGNVPENGLVLTNATAGGVVATYAYDDHGRPVEARTDSDGGARSVRQTTQYNALGQVAWVEDAANHRTAFAYDAAGRQSAVTNALGQVTQTAYDAEGRVLATWGATYPVAYEYDVFGRMTAMTTTRDPAHESVNLWTLVPAGSTLAAYSLQSTALDLTQWQYDLATGFVTNKVYADGKGTAYAYTADGKLSRRTWARGIATDYGYTTAGELETVNYSDATPDVTYTHDRLGRPVTITDALGARTNVYDVATLALAEERLPDGLTLTRSQDVLGRAAGISMPDYAVEYGYDAYGRFGSVTSSVVNLESLVVNYSYLPGSDLLAGHSTPGGMSFQRTFEPNRDLIASVTNAWNGTAVSSFAYTNDELGRRTARTDNGSVTNLFGYNLRSEVTSALMGANEFGYQYDPIGNRLTATNNAAVTTYAANELNQYTNVVTGASVTPTYDDDGNMASYGPWAFAWDGENRLISATNAAHQVSYRYDYQGRMIEKTVDSVTTCYQWDGFNIIAETDSGGTRHNVWGLDLSGTRQGAGGVGGLLAVVRNGGTHFACYDANGNITEYVNAAGNIVAHREYSPFGETTVATGNADAFTHWWSTKPWDPATGFSEYQFRMYVPELGRWLSRDPVEEHGGIGILNYQSNNSIVFIDSLGLDFIAVGGTEVIKRIWKFNIRVSLHIVFQYWKCDIDPSLIGKWLNPDNLKGKYPAIELVETFEMVRPQRYKPDGSSEDIRYQYTEAAKGYPAGIPMSLGYFLLPNSQQTQTREFEVSVIRKSTGDKARARTGIEIMPVFHDGNPDIVRAKWDSMAHMATEEYPFSEGDEQKLTDRKGRLIRYPYSIYGYPFTGNYNNSNTFGRWLLHQINFDTKDIANNRYKGNLDPVEVSTPAPLPSVVIPEM